MNRLTKINQSEKFSLLSVEAKRFSNSINERIEKVLHPLEPLDKKRGSTRNKKL
jgi:hypothetical protein